MEKYFLIQKHFYLRGMGLQEIRNLKDKAKEPKIKKPYYLPKKSAKKIKQEAEAKALRGPNEETKLQVWYKQIKYNECGIRGIVDCWECGEPIYPENFHAATGHILPKRKNMFPSVATHPVNYLILGTFCGCHAKYDSAWSTAATMKIWPEAVRRFKEILPKIAENEKARIPDEFLK